MPIVHAYIASNTILASQREELAIACTELVAAGFNCHEGDEGKLTPQDIIFMASTHPDIGMDAYISIKLYPFEERVANLDERTRQVLTALSSDVFDNRHLFGIGVEFLQAWESNFDESPSDEEPPIMTIEAALQRALKPINKIRNKRNRQYAYGR